jgi:peptidyl-prolyl cis-trans isomerase C
MRTIGWLVLALACGVGGYLLGTATDEQAGPSEPAAWVARVGDEYITRDEFVAEMARRGGLRAGQFRSVDQRRVLLNTLLVERALIDAARKDGFDRRPEIRRAMDSILVTRYRQERLQPLRDDVVVTPEEIEAFYRERRDEYRVPARKRLAMVFFRADDDAPEAVREQARARAETVLAELDGLELEIPHFGELARRYSDHQGSRYRGGVIGWMAADGDGSRFDPLIRDAARALQQPGEVSPVLEGEDGFYIVRLVQFEAGRERELDQLRDGIRQRILGNKLREVEQQFLDRQLAGRDIEINERAVAEIEPLSEPRRPDRPPTGPSNREDEG